MVKYQKFCFPYCFFNLILVGGWEPLSDTTPFNKMRFIVPLCALVKWGIDLIWVVEDPSWPDLLSVFIWEGKAKWTSEIKYGLILVMYQPCVPASSSRVHVISITGRPGARISGRSKGFVRYATISQLMPTRKRCCRWGRNTSRPPVFVVFS